MRVSRHRQFGPATLATAKLLGLGRRSYFGVLLAPLADWKAFEDIVIDLRAAGAVAVCCRAELVCCQLVLVLCDFDENV